MKHLTRLHETLLSRMPSLTDIRFKIDPPYSFWEFRAEGRDGWQTVIPTKDWLLAQGFVTTHKEKDGEEHQAFVDPNDEDSEMLIVEGVLYLPQLAAIMSQDNQEETEEAGSEPVAVPTMEEALEILKKFRASLKK